ncbi:MAG: hypothetical protein SF028_04895 [Candidatus Sumerlaeia bacterium]|nr:hypothetical protein [Candidatus Sumerlaeia bacterium]
MAARTILAVRGWARWWAALGGWLRAGRPASRIGAALLLALVLAFWGASGRGWMARGWDAGVAPVLTSRGIPFAGFAKLLLLVATSPGVLAGWAGALAFRHGRLRGSEAAAAVLAFGILATTLGMVFAFAGKSVLPGWAWTVTEAGPLRLLERLLAGVAWCAVVFTLGLRCRDAGKWASALLSVAVAWFVADIAVSFAMGIAGPLTGGWFQRLTGSWAEPLLWCAIYAFVFGVAWLKAAEALARRAAGELPTGSPTG